MGLEPGARIADCVDRKVHGGWSGPDSDFSARLLWWGYWSTFVSLGLDSCIQMQKAMLVNLGPSMHPMKKKKVVTGLV